MLVWHGSWQRHVELVAVAQLIAWRGAGSTELEVIGFQRIEFVRLPIV